MFALLFLTNAVMRCDDPVIVDDDVEITHYSKFDLPLELPDWLRQQLRFVRIYVSTDQGKSWVLHKTLDPSADEVAFDAMSEGMLWLTIQYGFNDKKIAPNSPDQFRPKKKIYITLKNHNVIKRHDDLNTLITPAEEEASRQKLSPALRSKVSQLEQDYGVQLVLSYSGFPIEGYSGWIIRSDQASPSGIEKFLTVYLEEWCLYPRSIWQKANLKMIVLCHNLQFGDELTRKKRVWDKDNGNVFAGGFPDIRHNAVFYDVIQDRSDMDEKALTLFQHNAVHHELFHFLDLRMRDDLYDDADWTILNLPDFRYGSLNYWDRVSTNVTNRYPGFITRYAQDSIAEDKAETFSHMMLNLHEMECRAKDDEILAKKMARIKKDLEAFSPEFNEAFWNKIRYLERPRLTLKGKEDPWADAHPTLPPLPKAVEVTANEKPESLLVPKPSKRGLILHRRRCRQ